MNLIEKASRTLGRIRGQFDAGLKSVNAPLTDASAWTGSPYWGEGLTGMAGRKVQSRYDMVAQFTSWCYICAVTNANARASMPQELFVTSQESSASGNGGGGKRWRTISTRPVTKAKRIELARRSILRPYIVKAEEVEEVTDHAFIDLMEKPNGWMSWTDLKWLTSIYMDLTGASYWYINSNNIGAPSLIWPIPSQYIKPIPGKSIEEFIAGYKYERGSVTEILPVEEIIEIRYQSPASQYASFGSVQGVADAVYVNAKMYEFEESVFENKARVGGILESESRLSGQEMDRLKASWQEKYEGAARAGKTVMLPPGVTFNRDSMTPDELSFIEGKKITREEICIAFGVPISVLVSTDVNRANAETGDYRHAITAVKPWLMKLDDAINGKLLPMFDDSGKLFVASADPVMDDRQIVLAEHTGYVAAGVLTINDVRADLGKEAVDGGDEPLVNGMLTPLSQAIAEPEPVPDALAPFAGQGGAEDEQGGKPPKRKPKPGDEGDEGDEDEQSEKLARAVLSKIKAQLSA